MDCREAEVLISCRVDGECAGEDAQRLDSHLAECASCRALLRNETRRATSLREALAVDPASIQAIEREVVSRIDLLAQRSSTSRPWSLWGGALAAGMVVGVALWITTQWGPSVDVPGRPLEISRAGSESGPVDSPGEAWELGRFAREENRGDALRALPVDGDPDLRLETRRYRAIGSDSLPGTDGDERPPRFYLDVERLDRAMLQPVEYSWY